MNVKHILLSLVATATLLLSPNNAYAQVESPVKLGVRTGVNMTNQGINLNEIFTDVKKGTTEWGAGFNLGGVADIDVCNFITLQPGFYFQTHKYNYVTAISNFDNRAIAHSYGSANFTNFQIPLLVSFRLKLTKIAQWQLDAGPYLSFGLGGSNKLEHIKSETTDAGNNSIASVTYKNGFYDNSDEYIVGSKRFDWGFKFGTGLLFSKHYYVGVHYNAGCKNVGKPYEKFNKAPSVKNKSWDFSIGYNF